MKNYILIVVSLIMLQSCISTKDETYVQLEKIEEPVQVNKDIINKRLVYPLDFSTHYIVQTFGNNCGHLGVDINGYKQGNGDLGDTIKSIGNGKVTMVFITVETDKCTGYSLLIKYRLSDRYIIAHYRHCKEIFVTTDNIVNINTPIATVGNDCNLFKAHLHFEIRTDTTIGPEQGYGNLEGFIDPIEFIKEYNKKSRD
jgi:murein DD-endopeptidase MepM/ murein hydrolase activator NlpD